MRRLAVQHLDAHGAVRDFRTTDRFADLPGGPVRAPWSTPVDDWTVVDGRPRPVSGRAVWHLPDGPLTYAELDLSGAEILYNIGPPA